jgi:hypothetical protein
VLLCSNAMPFPLAALSVAVRLPSRTLEEGDRRHSARQRLRDMWSLCCINHFVDVFIRPHYMLRSGHM